MDNNDSQEPVDRLIAAITGKLHAKRSVLKDSLQYGRLTWRTKKNGIIEVRLVPEI